MKRYLAIAFCLTLITLLLENCHRDAPVKPNTTQNNPNDPDSLYQSTPYTFAMLRQAKPGIYFFGTPKSNYVDSLSDEGIQLGRRLFYDKHLSLDGHKACASCHHLQYAFSDSGYVLSTNEFGPTKRNTPALQNMAWETSFFWDGRQPTLNLQAQDAADHELGLNVTNAISYLQSDTIYRRLFKKTFGRPGTITENKIFMAIQQFLFTAVSCNSRFDSSLVQGYTQPTASDNDVFYNLFLTEVGDCFHCHAFGGNYLMTDFNFHNNGLDSAASIYDFRDPGRGGFTGKSSDYGLFKSPTLRNVALTGPYMHDGRYKTLEQVINFYSDSLQLSVTVDPFILKHIDTTATGQRMQVGGLHLTAQQKAEFVEFLQGFTDTSFMNNPNLKSPFPN